MARADRGHHLQRQLGYDIFWSIAFAGTGLPWISWAAGDLAVKLGMGVFLLGPFRALLWRSAPRRQNA